MAMDVEENFIEWVVAFHEKTSQRYNNQEANLLLETAYYAGHSSGLKYVNNLTSRDLPELLKLASENNG